MPSALEKLVKILRLEQEQGNRNTAVIGGLQSYMPNWMQEARQQAKTPVHHALVDELAGVMLHYGTLSDRQERYNTVKYMLGRITGRTEPDPRFAVEPSVIEATTPPTESETPLVPPSAPSKGEIRRTPPRQPKVENRDLEARETSDTFDRDEAHHENLFVETQETPPDFVAEAPPRPVEDLPPAYMPKPRRMPSRVRDTKAAKSFFNDLSADVTTLRGIGKKRGEQLAQLGIYTINDLLWHFPRRYDDFTRLLPIRQLPVNEQVTVGGVVKEVTDHYARDKRNYLSVIIHDSTGQLRIVFFNQMYLKQQLTPGMQIMVYGKTELYLGKITMTNPEWEEVDLRTLEKGLIIPIYPLTEGITSRMMRTMIKQVIDERLSKMPDYMPDSTLDRTEMMDLAWALRQIHLPKNWSYLQYAQERLAFDELMLYQLGVLTKRRAWQSVEGLPIMVGDDWLNEFIAALPYSLTQAQLKAINDIRHDMQTHTPMNRLLQGDVGSGKTVVAALAMGIAIINRTQTALMAPTSVLAEQHFKSMTRLLSLIPYFSDLQIRLLTGAVSDSERAEIYRGLADSSIHCVVGTQALFQEKVEFANLGLAVIDEQHRFGVEERSALRGKGKNPHVLVMTATPIPRTLALTMFADLDLTTLDEMPPGRFPIETRLLFEKERERAYNFIVSQLEQGRQAFIVYPLVEESESTEAPAATKAFEELQRTTFRHHRVGLLHGRLRPAEKDNIMAHFASGEIQVLIATSVIEVGIDVPNATVILIEAADRFGLAQLHQFRGRVGRGAFESYCLLLSTTSDPEALERLRLFEETNDGFKLAELDWQMRGPGDLLGTRQSGFGPVQLGQTMDIRLVEVAQQESRAIFAEDPYLRLPEHELLAHQLEILHNRHLNTEFS